MLLRTFWGEIDDALTESLLMDGQHCLVFQFDLFGEPPFSPSEQLLYSLCRWRGSYKNAEVQSVIRTTALEPAKDNYFAIK